MAVTALALPGEEYTAQEWRQQVHGGLYTHAGNSITAHPGVVVGLDVTGASGARALVGSGVAVISPSHGPRGSYLLASDSVLTLNLAPADTVYSRWDAVVARVRDAAWGDASTAATIEAITGTPSVSPTYPPVPDGTLLLAYVEVPTSGTTAAVDQRLWTSAIGGAMSGTRAQRLALPTSHLRPGQTYTENADAPTATPPGKVGQTWRWTGAQWVPDFVAGYRAYIGQVMRPFSWSYSISVPAGRVYALPLRKAHGAGFDERNNLPCTITNGANVVVPYSGRYRIRASLAAPAQTTPAEFILGIRLNLNAAVGTEPGTKTDIGAVGSSSAGSILDEQPKYMGAVAANANHTMHVVEVPTYELAAGDSLSVSLWQNSTATQYAIYENPFIAYLDVTRLGD